MTAFETLQALAQERIQAARSAPEVVECEDCEGGECSTCDGTGDCQTCDGNGLIPAPEPETCGAPWWDAVMVEHTCDRPPSPTGGEHCDEHQRQQAWASTRALQTAGATS